MFRSKAQSAVSTSVSGWKAGALFCAFLLTACGQHGSSSSTSAVGAPDNLSYTTNPANYIVGLPITPNTLNSSKDLKSLSISPTTLPVGLSFDPNLGTISGTPTTMTAASVYTVTATNSYGTNFVQLTLAIVDHPPAFTYGGATSLTYTVGTPIAPITLTDTGGVLTSCSASPTLPAGLGLSSTSTTCTLVGTPTAPLAAKNYALSLNNTGGSATQTLNITVNDIPPAITYSPGSDTFSRGFAITPVNVTNGGGAIVSCASTPPLPTGLTLSNTCKITGTPSADVGLTSYSINATNSGGSDSFSLNVTVNDQVPSISYSPNTFTYTKGLAISTVTPINTGSSITSCNSVPPLPAGLSYSSACVITGTPSAISPLTSYSMTATNAGGTSAPATVMITVNNVAPSISFTGSPYTFTNLTAITPVTPANAGGAITGCSSSPTLPAGLSIANTTCQITGTPSSASPTANYTITATNTGGSSAKTIAITVSELAPNLSYTGSPFTYSKNVMITALNPNNSGGPITSCLSVPTLPSGLTLLSGCVISGTPTAVSTPGLNYTITATNAAGSSPSTINIKINDTNPAFSYPSSPYTFSKGQTISTLVPTNTGGTITSCAIAPATLTADTGLTLNAANCSISGTATATNLGNAFTYTVTGTNATGQTGTASVTITVNDVAPNISYTGSPYNFTVSAAITAQTPANTGGAITNCVAAPALPLGLILSTTTCQISGTPTVLQAATGYTLTASNSGGTGVQAISIQVSNVPTINYLGSPFNFVRTVAIATETPTNAGSPVTSCSAAPSLPAGLTLSSACVITGTPTVIQSATNYTITATNSDGSASTGISITVTGVPVFSYTGSPFSLTKGLAITTITPTNTGSPPTSCLVTGAPAALPAGLTLNADCSITGNPTILSGATAYHIKGTNIAGNLTVIINIAIVDVVPTISYAPTSYTFNNSVAITTVTPTLGGGALTSCSINPNLNTNTGLTFSAANCQISGTPNAYAPSQVYTVTATNSGGSATSNITVMVNDEVPVLNYGGSPYVWNINTLVPSAPIIPTDSGGTVVSCSSSPTLPAGLTLSNTCGISGTPTVMQAATNYTVTGTNTGGNATANISIAVITIPVLSYGSSMLVMNQAITTIIPTNTGSPATSCSSNPNLNAATGLTLNSDCSISGTPTIAGSATYNITGTNADGSSVAAPVTITFTSLPVISYSPSTYVFELRNAITAITITDTGGAISSCSASPTLPSGLTLSTTCGITGTPTSTSSATNYTITATNIAGSAAANVNLRVKDRPEILFYGLTNLNKSWNQSGENSQNAWKITDDGVDMVPLTQNSTGSGLDTILPTFIGTGSSVTFLSLTNLTGGSWNSTAATSYNVWSAAASGVSWSELSSAGSSSPTNLTAPRYSPDGTMIAFMSKQNIPAVGVPVSYNLWVMNANGTGAVALTQNVTTPSVDTLNLTWSPDSSAVYFASRMNNSTTIGGWDAGAAMASNNIWRVTANGTNLTRITNEISGSALDCIEPEVSPDGTTLVYSSKSKISGTTPLSFNIWWINLGGALPAAGTALTQNTLAGLDSHYPKFSVDNSTIAFQSLTNVGSPGTWDGGTNPSNNVWTITSWNSAPSFTALTNNTTAGLDSITPQYSSNDSKIVFSSLMNVGGGSSQCYNVWLMNVDGTGQSNVTANTAAGLDSLISPSSSMYIAP